jgi:glucokinase
MKSSFFLGIDIGGTKTEAVIVDGTREIVETFKEGTERTEIKENLQKIILGFEKKYTLNGIGIAIAGQVESEKGILLFGPNLKERDLPILDWVSSITSTKAVLLNDVVAAANAEIYLGSAKNEQMGLFVFLGTGIGGAFLLGGHLYPAEIGHMPVDFNGPKCTCGGKGCLEVFSSGWGLAMQSGLSNGKEVFEQGFASTIQQGEKAFASALIGATNFLNPGKIFLGGGLLKGYLSQNPSFLLILEQEIKNRALREAKVVQAKFSNDAPSIGAALRAMVVQQGSNTLDVPD